MTRRVRPELRDALARSPRRSSASSCAKASTRGCTARRTRRPPRCACSAQLGAHAVGMSTVPEVIALRHMGVRVAALSCITNLAAGLSKAPLDHTEVEETARARRDDLLKLLAGWVRTVGDAMKHLDEDVARQLVAAARAARAARVRSVLGVSRGRGASRPRRHMFTGCNVENASYGATICAERNAIAPMVAAGSASPSRARSSRAGPNPDRRAACAGRSRRVRARHAHRPRRRETGSGRRKARPRPLADASTARRVRGFGQ